MKKKILLILTLFGILYSYSQDSIFLVNNNIIAAKITDINSEEITFKKFNNYDGPNYHEKKTNILRIKYNNGDIEFYAESENFGAGAMAEHGEPATIILISDKAIPCEIMDITKLCVIYKEKNADDNTLVVMKDFVDKIWMKDSTFSTFSKDGQEFKHPKPARKQPDPVTKKEEDNPNTSSTETKNKEEAPKPPVASDKTRKILKGECELLDANGDPIKTRDVMVDLKNRRVTYVDQYNKIVTKNFGEIVMIYYKRGNNNRTPLDLTGQFEIDDLEEK